jgi:hypothetical protein
MRINWHQNPLRTTIELDDRDREQMLLYVQNEKYLDILAELDNWLERKTKKDNEPTLEKVHEKVRKWSQIYDMEIDHEEVRSYESFLQESHGGDCTCWPASCMKCHAEAALGISTIEGLGKHSAHKIMGAFHGDRTIDEAIAVLEQKPKYEKPDNWPTEYEKHITRWESERKAAIEWLKNYKKTHGF